MMDGGKPRTLLYLLLAGMLTILIAAALPRLELHPGLPLPRLESSQWVFPPSEELPAVAVPVNTFLRNLFLLVLAGLLLNLLYRLIRGIRWREALANFLKIALVILAVVFALYLLLNSGPSTQEASLPELPTPPAPAAPAPLGPVPSSLIWLVGIGLAILAALLGFYLLSSNNRPPLALNRVGLEAERARQAILTGSNLKDVIIQAYRQMGLALQQEQGIERGAAMTPREFERLLEAGGFPHDPVHRLTQLFEAVRYGRWEPGPQDEHQALDCLQAIVQYSHAGGSPG